MDKFCILGRNHFSVFPNGSIHTCCNDSSLFKKTIYDGTIDELRNDEYFKTLRTEMLNDIIPKDCTKCFKREELGIKSYRIMHNERYKHNIHDNTFTEKPNKLTYLDLRFGNKCNLKCLMCSPEYSNQLIDEHSEYYSNNTYKTSEWYKDDKIFNDILNNLHHVEKLHLTGGEPLLINELDKLYEHCINTGLSKNMILSYISNGTVYREKLLEYWKYFKEITLTISLDGINKVNDYIRFPSKWNIIDNNIKKYKEIKSNINLNFNHTINIYNIFHLREIIEYNNIINVKLHPFNILNYPPHLNIKSLPMELKEEITEFYKNDTHKEIINCITFMNSEDMSINFPEFIKYTKFMDSKRNNSVLDINPQFKNYF